MDINNVLNGIFLSKNFKKGVLWLISLFIAGTIGWYWNKTLDKIDKGDIDDKYIAVVISNKKDDSFTIPKEFRLGFGGEDQFDSKYSKQHIRFTLEDDFLSPEQAEIISKKLVNDENCVLIIGNSTSSLTEITLNIILSSKKSKPSFLLPIATADNILAKAKDQKYDAIYRMMPNNNMQAKTIKEFILRHFKFSNPKIAILSDEDNTTYSYNLSQNIADKIILDEGSEDKKANIIYKRNYGNSNRLIDFYNELKQQNQIPDVIVFVGISTNGSLLMEELKNLEINTPVIFTDGCTVKRLMEKSKNNPNYYFLSAVENIPSNQAPTYEPVGKDAKELALKIINGIQGNITRESVYNFIKDHKNKSEDLLIKGKAGKYNFNQDGDNISMNWKVYRYNNGKLEMVFDGK